MKTARQKQYVWYAVLWTACSLLAVHFFEPFPNGWDQAEYAWCLKQDYLPHSPYILFFLLGKAFYWLLGDAAQALSALSLVAGFASLILFTGLNWRVARVLCEHTPLESDSIPTDHTKTRKNIGTTVVARRSGQSREQHRNRREIDRHSSQETSSPESSRQRPFQPTFIATLSASLATLLLGTNCLFVRQSSTAEVYVVQLFFLLLAAFLLLDGKRDASAWSGVAYGCAIATHSGSIFLMPCAVFLVWLGASQRRQSWRNSLGKWAAAATVTIIVFCGVLYGLLPQRLEDDHWSCFVHYLRGITFGIDFSRLADLPFLQSSFGDLLHRLTSQDIPQGRMAIATMPVGVTAIHVLLAIGGAAIMWRIDWRPAIFWILWALPYLGYEVLLGSTPDFGVYAVFFLPCLMSFLAFLIVWVANKIAIRFGQGSFVAAAMGLLAFPSFLYFVQHWDDVRQDAIAHFSPWRLAAIAAAKTLPPDAIVIQPSEEWNGNLPPYYTGRCPMQNVDGVLFLLRPTGRFTPMNLESYIPVTSETLATLLTSGAPVYAFEPEPLRGVPSAVCDERLFQWEPACTLNLDDAKDGLALPADLKQCLPGGQFVLYQGSLLNAARGSEFSSRSGS